MAFSDLDRTMMQRALLLARAGAGCVSPNPLVGCVIMSAGGEILGEGAHLAFGEPHAEPNAISDAESKGRAVHGATAYVTLEPHAHLGKTPPCTKLLIQKGIARCVIAMEDPNPRVSGAGIRELRAVGIDVEVGLMEDEARELNRFFIKNITSGLPYVTMKLASTLDGRSALSNGESRWITSEASRTKVHEMRAEHDAVLIGTRTAALDDPELTVRLTKGRQPWRLVLDARLDLSPRLKIFTDEHSDRTKIITTQEAMNSKGETFNTIGIEMIAVDGSGERIDLSQMLRKLGARDIASILVEPGSTLASSFIAARLVDELAIFYAPTIFGGDAQPSVGSLAIPTMSDAPRFKLKGIQRMEGADDVLLRLTNLSSPN